MTVTPSGTETTLPTAAISIGNLRFAALLAALANASLHQVGPNRCRFRGVADVERALDWYRRLTDANAQIDSPGFVCSILRDAPVTVVARLNGRPSTIDATEYDAANGEGLAAEVIARVHRTGSVATHDLSRFEYRPASWGAITLAIGGVLFVVSVLCILVSWPKH